MERVKDGIRVSDLGIHQDKEQVLDCRARFLAFCGLGVSGTSKQKHPVGTECICPDHSQEFWHGNNNDNNE